MKRLIALIAVLLLFAGQSFGATAYFYPSAGSDWTGANWFAATNGGGGAVAVPDSTVDVILDGNSGVTVVVDGAAKCKSITCTGFLGDLKFNAQLKVSGNITFVNTMSMSGTLGSLVVDAAGTLNSGGVTVAIPVPMTFTQIAPTTYTLASDWNVDGLLTFDVPTGTTPMTLAGAYSIYAGGGLYRSGAVSGNVASAANAVTVRLNGTGTVDATGGSRYFSVNLSIEAAANTVTWTALHFSTRTLTYTSGVMAGAKALSVFGGTYDTGGMTWGAITQVASAQTQTLLSNLNCTSYSHAGNQNEVYNGFSVVVSGGFTSSAPITSGTSIWRFTGGTALMATAGSVIKNPVTLAGDVTIGSRFGKQDSAITYESGNITTTGSRLVLYGNTRLNTAGVTWDDVTIMSAGADTLTSEFAVAGICSVLANVEFRGSAGWVVDSLYVEKATTTILKSGVLYRVLSDIRMAGATGADSCFIRSSVADSRAMLRLLRNTTQTVTFVNALDIDSRGGRGVYAANGTLDNALNWSVSRLPAAMIEEYGTYGWGGVPWSASER